MYPGVVSTVDQPQRSAGSAGDRLEFETLLAVLSSRFINLSPAEVDRGIEDALRRVCEHLDIGYALLWQWSVNAPGVITPTHAYPADKNQAAGSAVVQEHYPWSVAEVQAGRTIVLASLADAPAEAAADVEFARQAGIKSSLILPLCVGGEPPVGALAFNATQAERDWPGPLVKRLQLVAQVLANALARKRADEVGRRRRGVWRLAPISPASPFTSWTTERAPPTSMIGLSTCSACRLNAPRASSP